MKNKLSFIPIYLYTNIPLYHYTFIPYNTLLYDRYKYGFQVSSSFPTTFLMNIIWLGLKGLFRRLISASSGVLSPFLLLHTVHAATRFSHESLPPLAFGTI
jgi:hypothetical protein